MWGAGSVAETVTSRYLFPGSGSSTLAPVDVVGISMPSNGTLHKMAVVHNVVGVGGDITYTMLVNGVASALSVSLAASGGTASNAVDNVPIVSGDIVSVQVSKGGAIATSPQLIQLTMELY